jgi:hypothetical protein
MRKLMHRAIGGVCLVGCTLSCSSQPLDDPKDDVGLLQAAIEMGPRTHDVTAVRFDVVPAEGDCNVTALSSVTVPLESELAPTSGSGAEMAAHHFASALFTLATGDYRACATPLSGSSASETCAPTSELATVAAELTTPLMLVSQCQGDHNGGLEVGVVLNDPPRITAVTVTESTFITVCESANIQVAAEDANGDALSYDWSLVSGPEGGRLRSSDSSATFSGRPGDYVVRVVATDTHAAEASFLVTIHVTDATCIVPPEVQGIITAKCSPCHTTGSSGGLKLAPADVAYTSLVSHAVGSAACASKLRVVPGDAENSYLMAKLRSAPGICGLPMPRNLPPLPEGELQTIENWINSLPH